VGPEGALRVGLRIAGGRITDVQVHSSRPDVARTLLSGRSRSMVTAMVPRLFSICAHSQTVACELACAVATGEALGEAELSKARAAVAAETMRETTWRTLLDWPKALGEPTDDAAVAAARAAREWTADALHERQKVATVIASAAFGMPADEWLGLRSLEALAQWAAQGQTATARFVQRLREDSDAQVHGGASPTATVPLLTLAAGAHDIIELAEAVDADPAFSSRPKRRGAPAETGTLARMQADPVVKALMQCPGSRVPARYVARLRELALLLTEQASASVGALALPNGGGVAWVENARGLLLHRLRLDQGRTVDYRIVAPTEWNFHPAGALPLALRNTPAHDRDAVRQRASVLVNSLDPCVACHVEFDDA
jgi:coenzyme F420-reducing hydrogenase alpha subunit